MHKKTEALKLAEDALKRVRTQDMELVQLSMIALAAIREALAEQPAQDNTYGYAKYLAEAMFKRHFASDKHYASGRVVWGVNDTVIGILTQIDNMVADMVRRPAQVDGDTIVQTFTGLPRRKLRDLLSGGWEVNGVCFQRTETDGTVRRGAATTGGMVLWWNAEQPAPMIRGDIRDGLVDDEPAHQHIEHCLWARNGNQPCPHVQPAQQQEPVGRLESDPYEGHVFVPRIDGDWSMLGKNLYTSPQAQRTWVGLTDEDIKEAEWLLSAIKEHEAYTLQEQLLVEGVDVFARAIEAKLREKNNG